MNSSYNIYIGPYIEVYNPKTDSNEDYCACNKLGCSQHRKRSSAEFCPECGSKICTMNVLKRPCFDIYAETTGRLAVINIPDEDYVFYQPNIGEIGRRFSAYHSCFESINEMNITEEIIQMMMDFKPDLEKLQEVFGHKNVKCKWGVFTHTN